MRKISFLFMHACALSAVFVGAAGCAMDGAPVNAGDQAADDRLSEPSDLGRAAQIAKVKRARLGIEAISPQSAACGNKNAVDLDKLFIPDAALTAARQRTGSSTGCPAVGELQPSDDAVYFCFTFAGNDATWTYLSNTRTGVQGWTRDDLLRPPPGKTIGGADAFCGF